MKMQVLLTVLLAAAGIALAAAPEIKDNAIIYGDIKVNCAGNGDITVSNSKGEISKTYCHYSVVDPAKNKTDWSRIKAKDCTMTFKGRKFTWILNRTSFGKTWKAVDQTLEVLEDGRLKLTIKKYPAPEGLKLYDNCVFTQFPFSAMDGKTIKYQGKDVKLTAGKKPITRIGLPSVKGVKGTTYSFPLKPGSVSYYSECRNGLTAYSGTKDFRLTWYLPASGTGIFIIDIK